MIAIEKMVVRKKLSVNLFLLLSILFIGVLFIIESSFNSALYFVVAIMLAAIILVLQIEDPVLRKLILVALFLRLSLALIQSYTAINLPGAGDDSVRFERLGWEIAQSWFYGTEYEMKHQAMYYSFWIGLLYSIAGRLPLIPKMANIIFSLVTIYLIYKSVLAISNNYRAARISALLLLIIPTINVFAAILLRESMLILFVVMSFYFMIKWIKEGWFGFPILAFLTLAIAGIMHGVLLLLMWVYALLMIFYSHEKRGLRFSIKQLILSFGLLIIAYLFLGKVITYQVPENLMSIFTPDYLRSVIERKALGRTSYLQGLSPYSYFDLLWQTPIRVIYLIFTPFPWLIENWRDLLGSVEAMFYLILCGYGLFGIKYLYSKNKYAVLTTILIFATMAVMFAWGTTNYGTAWRHRQKLAPFIVVLASAGIASSKRLQWLLPDEDYYANHNRQLYLG